MGNRRVLRLSTPPPEEPIAFDNSLVSETSLIARASGRTDISSLFELAALLRASAAFDTAAMSEVAQVFDRNSLVIGVDEPGPTTTGVYSGIPRQVVNGDVTISTPQTYENKTVNGRISVATSGLVTIRNCLVRGQNTTPTGSYLIQCTNSAVDNVVIEDCEIAPQYAHWDWNGIGGHHITARRNNIHHVVDGIDLFNSSAPSSVSGDTIDQNWIHDLAWWTASTSGVVHTSDTETHNDCIQIHWAIDPVIRGNRLDAYFARQYAHWFVTNPSVEPYTTVALNSLGAGAPGFGGPYQVIPNRPATNGTTPPSGTNNEANGRYNVDDLACLMVNALSGPTTGITFHDNFCYGGNFAVNAGLSRGAGQHLGTFYRNKFSRDQGAQGSEGNTTYTISIDSTWVGNVDGGVGTANKNYYMDNGAEVTFRVNG